MNRSMLTRHPMDLPVTTGMDMVVHVLTLGMMANVTSSNGPVSSVGFVDLTDSPINVDADDYLRQEQ